MWVYALRDSAVCLDGGGRNGSAGKAWVCAPMMPRDVKGGGDGARKRVLNAKYRTILCTLLPIELSSKGHEQVDIDFEKLTSTSHFFSQWRFR